MARKEFTYKGKTEEELKAMDLKEFAILLPSNLRRSLTRGIDDSQKKVIEKLNKGKNKIKTHSREMVIIPLMIGKTISIYTGRKFQDVEITMEMLGHRIGEYASSRVIAKHTLSGVGSKKKVTSIRK